MVYSEELAIQQRVLDALREAYPDRAYAMGDQVKRWFTRHWRNSSAAPIVEANRCRLCDLQLSMSVSSASGGIRSLSFPVCFDCMRDAVGTATDERWPSRDMVRNEALRALRATGDETAAAFVQEIASGFPDLVRETSACDACKKTAPVARGLRGKLCAPCLHEIQDEYERLHR